MKRKILGKPGPAFYHRALGVVLLLAAGLRLWKIGEFSLWEDEEGSIYFSRNPDKPFPGHFPVFFLLLRGVYHFTGVSVAWGRSVAAAMGMIGIFLVYPCFKRYIGRGPALVSIFFLSVNLGHLFFSQSIRYYTTVLAFQILSAHGFLDGFQRGSAPMLLLSLGAFAAALMSHFSALLLAPVFVAYILLAAVSRDSGGYHRPAAYLLYLALLTAILLFFGARIASMQGMIKGWVIPSGREPLYLLITLSAYFGLPLMVLGTLGALFSGETESGVKRFFVLLAFIPLLELMVIAAMNVVNVAWYYGFVSVVGFAVLSSLALAEGKRRGRSPAVKWAWILSVSYYLVFLFSYYGPMHGDRPRWKETAAYFKENFHRGGASGEGARIFSTSPGVIAFYMGVPPEKTMGHPMMVYPPLKPPETLPSQEQWYLVRAGHFVTKRFAPWFEKNCILVKTFRATTGTVDRSVLIYRYVP